MFCGMEMHNSQDIVAPFTRLRYRYRPCECNQRSTFLVKKCFEFPMCSWKEIKITNYNNIEGGYCRVHRAKNNNTKKNPQKRTKKTEKKKEKPQRNHAVM